MANPTIRMVALYLKGKKAAFVHQVSYAINPARSPAYGQDGYLAHTKGAITCNFTLDEVTPLAGSSFTELLSDILNQKDIDCSVRIGGKLHKVTCAVTAVSFKSATESGMSDGSMTLAGGVPVLT